MCFISFQLLIILSVRRTNPIVCSCYRNNIRIERAPSTIIRATVLENLSTSSDQSEPTVLQQ